MFVGANNFELVFEEPLFSDSHGSELIGITTGRVERGRYRDTTMRIARNVCEKLSESIATGKHADACNMGVFDIDETDCLGRAGKIQDQPGSLLLRCALFSVEHGNERLRDIHHASLGHHRQST